MNHRFFALLLAVLVWSFVSLPASADLILYSAVLSGPAEDPPNASPGTGSATVGFDPVAHTLSVSVSFEGLIGTVTNAHIHGPTTEPLTGVAGVATTTPTFVGFPSGVTSGDYDALFDTLNASTYNAAFVTNNGGTVEGAEAALGLALAEGRAYFNIHTSEFGGGEIRGFLTPVPEPSGVMLLGLGGTVGLLGYGVRRRLQSRT